MSKTYFKNCVYCKEEIEMSDKEGKWLPFNKDGSAHDCRKKNEKASEQNHKEITLEMVQRKLESIGIIINVGRLMSDK